MHCTCLSRAQQAYSESLEVARGDRDYKSMAQSHNEIMSFMKKAISQVRLTASIVVQSGVLTAMTVSASLLM